MKKKIGAFACDGIGPEIMEACLAVLDAVAGQVGFDYEIEDRAFGGAGSDAIGHPLPKETIQACRKADALL
ncbi:isocitrate/isopropylmalate family dehydrogenase, partial [Streptococcus suis]